MSLKLSLEQIRQRIHFDNPWWRTSEIDTYNGSMKEREYFKLFIPIVKERSIKRAVVLLGPRRVGKTVMIYHSVKQLISEGIKPKNICYMLW